MNRCPKPHVYDHKTKLQFAGCYNFSSINRFEFFVMFTMYYVFAFVDFLKLKNEV